MTQVSIDWPRVAIVSVVLGMIACAYLSTPNPWHDCPSGMVLVGGGVDAVCEPIGSRRMDATVE